MSEPQKTQSNESIPDATALALVEQRIGSFQSYFRIGRTMAKLRVKLVNCGKLADRPYLGCLFGQLETATMSFL